MRVIFLKDTPGAKKNRIKEVPKGYALNYLLPQKLAVVATPEKITALEKKVSQKQDDQQNTNSETEKLLKTIKNLKIEIQAKANKEGHLFGGISNEDIQKILKKEHNLDISKEAIELPHHLKEIGKHKVSIKIANSKTESTVNIKAE